MRGVADGRAVVIRAIDVAAAARWLTRARIMKLPTLMLLLFNCMPDGLLVRPESVICGGRQTAAFQ